jgi:hypothetical protein
MSVLSAIPLLLLGVFCVWFLWPIVVDPMRSRLANRRYRSEHDRMAQNLFDRWTSAGPIPDADQN